MLTGTMAEIMVVMLMTTMMMAGKPLIGALLRGASRGPPKETAHLKSLQTKGHCNGRLSQLFVTATGVRQF